MYRPDWLALAGVLVGSGGTVATLAPDGRRGER
jgi:hypothetical protein